MDKYRFDWHQFLLEPHAKKTQKPWTNPTAPHLGANLALSMSSWTPPPSLLNAQHWSLPLVLLEMLAWPVVPWGEFVNLPPSGALTPLGEMEVIKATLYLTRFYLQHIASLPLSRTKFGAHQVLACQSPPDNENEGKCINSNDIIVLEGFKELDRK